MNTSRILRWFGFVAVSELAGILGALFTTPEIPTWYAGLNKPTFNPPEWVFGPVWTILYLLIGAAAYAAWSRASAVIQKKRVLILFGLQWVLNLAWSVIFFRLHWLTAASVEIVLLWLAILWMMVYYARFSKWTVAWLLPYLAWVGFATYLTVSIMALN